MTSNDVDMDFHDDDTFFISCCCRIYDLIYKLKKYKNKFNNKLISMLSILVHNPKLYASIIYLI